MRVFEFIVQHRSNYYVKGRFRTLSIVLKTTFFIQLKSKPFLIRRQIMRLLGLADFFKFRACLAGRYLCSQNVNKYSKQPAKPSKHVIQFRIRNDIDFSKNIQLKTTQPINRGRKLTTDDQKVRLKLPTLPKNLILGYFIHH